MPYQVCFKDDQTKFGVVFGYMIDGMFIIDILINFLSVNKKRDGTYMTTPKDISIYYLQGWFVFDFISAF